MRLYTRQEAEKIAEACEGYLYAHSRRKPEATSMTPREEQALTLLRYAIAAREREAVETATGVKV
jgi:hypothetical protein